MGFLEEKLNKSYIFKNNNMKDYILKENWLYCYMINGIFSLLFNCLYYIILNIKILSNIDILRNINIMEFLFDFLFRF